MNGYPLYPTIFNVVVDTVLCHWRAEVAREEVGTNGVWRVAKYMSTFFYVDDGLLGFLKAERLKRELNVLTDIFYWVLL